MSHELIAMNSSTDVKNLLNKISFALVDSGASVCMFGDSKFFVPGSLKSTYKTIRCADGKFLYAHWEGTVILIKDPTKPPHPSNTIVCKDALLVEGIAKSLLSVPQLDDTYSFLMEKGKCTISSPPLENGKRTPIYKIQQRRYQNIYTA